VKSINCTGFFLKKKLFSEQWRHAPLFTEQWMHASTVFEKKNCSLNSKARIRILAAQEAAPSCFLFSCVSKAADHGTHEQ